ncbi:acyl-CoA dehydrogenase family protein [Actinopolyspora halophila]|uniref:acyl-CoA dehydrogenase family protein n=1 Tax=Actinopolyspora halophila TaxID=1850 RepID=UPI0003A8463E|nr:acyl-CoA dehydrogenase family protein [Actinopolyspora halophila]
MTSPSMIEESSGDTVEFGWTAEQERRYRELLEASQQRYHTADFDGVADHGGSLRGHWPGLAELGVLGLAVPGRHGGQGHGALDTARMFEAFGCGWPDTGVVFAVGAHQFACAVPLARFGGEALRERWLPGMCSGELIAGNAMTEQEAGSDVSGLSVTAHRVTGGYLLDGTKSFVSNGPVADVLVVYATTDPEAGYLGQTAFLVETTTDGVEAGGAFAKMGLESVPAGTVTFRECFVPDANVLGHVGGGAAIFQHSMGWERSCLFAGYLGLLDRIVDDVRARVTSRKQFGESLSRFQAVAHRVADMKLRAESARLLLYRACWEIDRNGSAPLDIALSKLAVSESVVASALDAVRLFGAEGYRVEPGIERVLRDSVPSLLFSGTSEIQKNVIARELGL